MCAFKLKPREHDPGRKSVNGSADRSGPNFARIGRPLFCFGCRVHVPDTDIAIAGSAAARRQALDQFHRFVLPPYIARNRYGIDAKVPDIGYLVPNGELRILSIKS